ncbi:MAG: hypothetical protein AB7I59_23120 [Geminicoccaceae bacterium]
MRTAKVTLLLAMALAGCATPHPVRKAPPGSAEIQPRASGATEGTVEGAPAAILERAAAALQAQGLTLSVLPGPNGVAEATGDGAVDPSWADCPTITVRDPFSEALRSRRKNAAEMTTRVTVSTAAATPATTRIAVRALFLGNYVNDFTGNPQQAACRSTGALEQAVLEAVREGG